MLPLAAQRRMKMCAVKLMVPMRARERLRSMSSAGFLLLCALTFGVHPSSDGTSDDRPSEAHNISSKRAEKGPRTEKAVVPCPGPRTFDVLLIHLANRVDPNPTKKERRMGAETTNLCPCP